MTVVPFPPESSFCAVQSRKDKMVCLSQQLLLPFSRSLLQTLCIPSGVCRENSGRGEDCNSMAPSHASTCIHNRSPTLSSLPPVSSDLEPADCPVIPLLQTSLHVLSLSYNYPSPTEAGLTSFLLPKLGFCQQKREGMTVGRQLIPSAIGSL